jgi:hypothetical protein
VKRRNWSKNARLIATCALLCVLSGLLSVSDSAQADPVEDGAAGSSVVSPVPQSPQPGDQNFVPLSPRDRASLFFKGYMGNPLPYYAATTAAVGELLAGEPEGWPRSFSGYSRRAGSQITLLMFEEGVHEGGDAALGLDPRYYRCRCAGFLRRSGHALKMTFLAYDAQGHLHLDTPRLAGDYGGAMLITSWYPSQYRARVQGVQMGHVQVALDGGINLAREFLPEMKRLFGHHKAANQDASIPEAR